MMDPTAAPRARKSHIWARETNEHYVEPKWCSERLFQVEEFVGGIHDPCCGFGTIPQACIGAGLAATAADIADRGYYYGRRLDFFEDEGVYANIVCNPPFKTAPDFTQHALKLAVRKVAVIFPTARLNAAHWLRKAPLRRVWLLTPRPSMPPGHVIAAGNKPGGGKMDFCWLVLEHEFSGVPEMRWLRRNPKENETNGCNS